MSGEQGVVQQVGVGQHHVGVVADPAALLDLVRALERLGANQRAAVMLVKSYGYSHREVAALLDVTESVVNNLVHRGVTRLRTLLEVHS